MALIACVIGTTGSGKSFTVESGFPHPLWIKGTPGKMIRSSIGMYHATEETNPNRFDLTEDLVRDYVYRLVQVADKVRRPVVLDGFPRDKQQADWFFSMFAEHEIMVFVIKPAREVKFVHDTDEHRRHECSIRDVADVMYTAVDRRILVKEFTTPWTDY